MVATDGLLLPRSLAVAHIKAAPLLFYDAAYVEKSFEFCRLRDLDALPSIDGGQIWVRNSQQARFDCIEMPKSRVVKGETYAFDPSVRLGLREHGVVFVEEDGDLVGAFHASDFNHPAVGRHLYDLLSRYERALRALALALDLSEQDLLEAVSPTRKKRYLHFREQSPAAPPLQIAYLDDLISLVSGASGLQLDAEAARRVRDATMHSQEFVSQLDPETPDYVFDTASFERLFDAVRLLIREIRLVANRLNAVADLGQIGVPR